MRKFVSLLPVLLAVFGSAAAKNYYTNKTFLTPRSENMNLAMESTTWHKQTALIDSKKWGGTVQVTGFYEESENEKDLGKYFGTARFNDNCPIQDYIGVVPHWIEPNPEEFLDSDWILYTQGADLGVSDKAQTLADKIVWRPYRDVHGIRLDYHQKFDKFIKGLFFKASIPFVHVKTSMGWTSTCCGCYCVKQKLQSGENLLGGAEKSLADYLSGNVSNDYTHAKQVALCKAKICDNSSTGVADVDVILGYNVLYEPTRHVNVNVGLTIPTGDRPTGDYLFEAIVGNNHHWALGAGIDSKFELWKRKKMSLDLLLAFNYRFLFSATEERVMSFLFPSDPVYFGNGANEKAPYGYWMLGAKAGDTFATPMANFLAKHMSITPRNHFDGITQLAFNWGNFTFDVGYNLFAKDAEEIELKDCWQDDTYALIDPSYDWDTADAFVIADHSFGGYAINWDRIDLNACRQPAVVTHKIYGGAGYAFKKWSYPIMLGLGGSYEWGYCNDSLDMWSIWAKAGITF